MKVVPKARKAKNNKKRLAIAMQCEGTHGVFACGHLYRLEKDIIVFVGDKNV